MDMTLRADAADGGGAPLPRSWKRLVAVAAVLVLAAVAIIVAVVGPKNTASALTSTETPTPVTGNATYFDALGSPYGGCGLPQSELDTQDFVALNVYDTPGDYSFYPRPLTGPDLNKLGMWNNGHNCGRWVKVTIGDFCTGVNDGAPGQAFCRNGSWVADEFNGATLNMIVADSCGDSNAWCRDDPYHLDFSKPSLTRFTKDGAAMTGLPNKFNNRRISWQFVDPPSYSGDITIGFMQGAQVWWPAITVSHLANGIHGVEYLANGAWQAAQMNGDMGQSFIIGATASGGSQFQIRVRDRTDQLINGGRVYSFGLPSSCGSRCSAAYTRVTYTTSGGSTTSAPATTTPATSAPVTSAPVTSAPVTSAPVTTRAVTSAPVTSGPVSSAPVTTRAVTSAPATTAGPPAACTAAYAVTGQWTGGFQGEVTVTAGAAAISGWTVTWTFANGQTVSQVWGGTLTSSGSAVTVRNVGWNGALAAGARTTFGFLGAWNGANAVPTVACTSP
ncbi:cellulose binding domain-containing protein [Luedemannella helvata]|uniref:Cellulose binding domain-containing protein n=1 Tax=Luedemannella helvata TaxID=349315 RepID=A0ABP4WP39_9ACTN